MHQPKDGNYVAWCGAPIFEDQPEIILIGEFEICSRLVSFYQSQSSLAFGHVHPEKTVGPLFLAHREISGTFAASLVGAWGNATPRSAPLRRWTPTRSSPPTSSPRGSGRRAASSRTFGR